MASPQKGLFQPLFALSELISDAIYKLFGYCRFSAKMRGTILEMSSELRERSPVSIQEAILLGVDLEVNRFIRTFDPFGASAEWFPKFLPNLSYVTPVHLSSARASVETLKKSLFLGRNLIVLLNRPQNLNHIFVNLPTIGLRGKLASNQLMMSRKQADHALRRMLFEWDKSGNSFLHGYCAENLAMDPTVVDTLVTDCGLDIIGVNNENKTPLHLLVGKNFTNGPDIPGQCSIIAKNFDLLLEHGADLTLVDNEGNTPLMCALNNSYPLRIVQELLANEDGLEAREEDGFYPMFFVLDHFKYPDIFALLQVLNKLNNEVSIADDMFTQLLKQSAPISDSFLDYFLANGLLPTASGLKAIIDAEQLERLDRVLGFCDGINFTTDFPDILQTLLGRFLQAEDEEFLTTIIMKLVEYLSVNPNEVGIEKVSLVSTLITRLEKKQEEGHPFEYFLFNYLLGKGMKPNIDDIEATLNSGELGFVDDLLNHCQDLDIQGGVPSALLLVGMNGAKRSDLMMNVVFKLITDYGVDPNYVGSEGEALFDTFLGQKYTFDVITFLVQNSLCFDVHSIKTCLIRNEGKLCLYLLENSQDLDIKGLIPDALLTLVMNCFKGERVQEAKEALFPLLMKLVNDFHLDPNVCVDSHSFIIEFIREFREEDNSEAFQFIFSLDYIDFEVSVNEERPLTVAFDCANYGAVKGLLSKFVSTGSLVNFTDESKIQLYSGFSSALVALFYSGFKSCDFWDYFEVNEESSRERDWFLNWFEENRRQVFSLKRFSGNSVRRVFGKQVKDILETVAFPLEVQSILLSNVSDSEYDEDAADVTVYDGEDSEYGDHYGEVDIPHIGHDQVIYGYESDDY